LNKQKKKIDLFALFIKLKKMGSPITSEDFKDFEKIDFSNIITFIRNSYNRLTQMLTRLWY